MNSNELNTEDIILEAAEAEFLEKGYGNAKMMSIAKRAGVSHSMLHYYFRNKENLFQTVFCKKAQIISGSFEGILEKHLPFLDTIRLFVETQFNFVAQNPKLPLFILTEILNNKENRTLLFEALSPKMESILTKFTEMLHNEISKGTVRPISIHNLMLNIISMNVSTFIALPVLHDMITRNQGCIELIIEERRESNVQFIINALRV